MNSRAIFERLKVLPWMWWAVWLLSVALLGLLILTHHTEEVRVLAESFRPEVMLMPIHILQHRGLASMAGNTLIISFVLAGIAVIRPSTAPIVIPAAVGIALLFFAFSTFFYSKSKTEWMRATVRQRASIDNQTYPLAITF